MIRALVFDVGGVLARDVWESMLLDESRGLAKQHGLDEALVNEVGQVLWNIYAHEPSVPGHTSRDLEIEYWTRLIEDLGISANAPDLIRRTAEFICPIPGMDLLLEQLRHTDINLAICSNTTEFWFERHWAALGLDRFFSADKVVISPRVGVSKTSDTLRMYERVVETLGIGPRQCLLIDDREENVERALDFGMPGIIFPSHSEYGTEYLGHLLSEMGLV